MPRMGRLDVAASLFSYIHSSPPRHRKRDGGEGGALAAVTKLEKGNERTMSINVIVSLWAAAMPVEEAPSKAHIDRHMPRWLKTAPVPSAAVAVIRGGRVRWTAAYGEARPGVPATVDTLYNVASLTKPLVAEAVLRLASKGRLDLDEPMSRHWVDPDLVDDPRHRQLTPRLALSHRTGLPNWRSSSDDGKLKFGADPGLESGYSGEGFEYVARFAEKKVGRGFESILQDEVLRPLGLERTALTEQPWFRRSVLAMPQGPDGSRRPPAVSSTWSAADDAFSRVGDYANFVATVMADAGVSPRLARQRLSVAVPQFNGECPWSPGCPKSVGFGLGWAIFDYGRERVILQGGADWGERAIAMFVPERGLGLVVLTNGARGSKVILEVVTAVYDNPDFRRFVAFQAR